MRRLRAGVRIAVRAGVREGKLPARNNEVDELGTTNFKLCPAAGEPQHRYGAGGILLCQPPHSGMIAAFGKPLHEQRYTGVVSHHKRAADTVIELLHQVQNLTRMRLVNLVVMRHLGGAGTTAFGTLPCLSGAQRARTQHSVNRCSELRQHPARRWSITQTALVQRTSVVGSAGMPRRLCVPHHNERVLVVIAGNIPIIHSSRVFRAR